MKIFIASSNQQLLDAVPYDFHTIVDSLDDDSIGILYYDDLQEQTLLQRYLEWIQRYPKIHFIILTSADPLYIDNNKNLRYYDTTKKSRYGQETIRMVDYFLHSQAKITLVSLAQQVVDTLDDGYVIADDFLYFNSEEQSIISYQAIANALLEIIPVASQFTHLSILGL